MLTAHGAACGAHPANETSGMGMSGMQRREGHVRRSVSHYMPAYINRQGRCRQGGLARLSRCPRQHGMRAVVRVRAARVADADHPHRKACTATSQNHTFASSSRASLEAPSSSRATAPGQSWRHRSCTMPSQVSNMCWPRWMHVAKADPVMKCESGCVLAVFLLMEQ